MPTEQVSEEALSSSLFALPAAVVEPYLEEIIASGLAPKRRDVTLQFLKLDAYVFSAETGTGTKDNLNALMRVLGPKPFSLIEHVRIGRRKGFFFCGIEGRVRVLKPLPGLNDLDEDDEDDEKIELGEGEESYYVGQARIFLQRLSRLAGGLNFTLHPELRGHGYPPLPDVPGDINIYTWTSPPGEADSYFTPRAFGAQLSKDSRSLLTYRGIPGRGDFVGDGKRDLAQIIGNNWYVLISLFTFAHRFGSEVIAERILAALLSRWQELRRGARTTIRAIPLKKTEFVKTASGWVNALNSELAVRVEKLTEYIERNRRDYEKLLRDHRDAVRDLEAVRSGEKIRSLLDSLPEQWKSIRKNVHVESVSRVGDGLHVATVPIVIEHEGARYSVGRFVIRLNKLGVLTLWNLDRLHPEGIPHPHISKVGHPCYGNASTAIERAVAEHRYADAVEYVTRWLADGYEPSLAQHPITQWPVSEDPRA